MKTIRESMLGLTSVGIFLAMAAVSASAQQASFKLPVEAHWGSAVLEPGEYKVRFPSAADSLRVIQVYGNGETLNFMPQVTSLERNPIETGRLSLTAVDGVYRVQSISDPGTARDFAFPLPKIREVAAGSLRPHTQTKIAVQLKKNTQ